MEELTFLVTAYRAQIHSRDIVTPTYPVALNGIMA
jgi:hypothetical protein